MSDSDSNTADALGRILASVFGITRRPYDTEVQVWTKVARSLGVRISPYDSLEAILERIAAKNPTGGAAPSPELLPGFVGAAGAFIDIEEGTLPENVTLGMTQDFNVILVDISGLKTLVFPSIQTKTSFLAISLNSCPDIETISLPVLTGSLSQLDLESLPALTSFSAPGLTNGGASATLFVTDCPNLSTFDAPNILLGATGFTFVVLNNLGSASLNNLGLAGIVEAYTVDIQNCVGLSGNQNFTAFTNLTSALVFKNTSVAGLQFPVLPIVGNALTVESNPSLTNVSFASLTTVQLDTSIKNNAALVTLSFPNWIPINFSNGDFSGNALNQASVDGVLARYVANPSYNTGTIDLSGGTNSAPSPAGDADKATLIGRGATVITN